MNLESFIFYITSSLIIFALIYNLYHYNPILGYDGEAHHAYVQNFLNIYVPGKSNQNASNFTYEFFSPPLPYVLPTIINETCKFTTEVVDYLVFCQNIYGFINIIFLSLAYLILLYIYMKILKKVFRTKNLQNSTTLLLLGLFSTNYKAISMIRAEIYILFFSALLIYRLLLLVEKSYVYKTLDFLIFGLIIGILALSRQWAFLLFPAFFFIIFFIENKNKKNYFLFLTKSFVIGFAISSWFYFGLYLDYGSFTSFNMESKSFNFSNQTSTFYRLSSEAASYFFSKPIRPYFGNSFFAILYSDLWGDYWGYFSFTSRSIDFGRNQLLIGDYLGRVNIVSIFPSILLVFGFINSLKSVYFKKKTTLDILNTYLAFATIFSFFGYLWFLITYPETTGDTIKSTYIIQLFHLIGLTAVIKVEKIRINNKKLYDLILISLLIVFIHNFQTMLSHFPKIDLF